MAKFRCTECSRAFDTEQGRRLHHARAHTTAGRNWGKNPAKGVAKQSPRGSIKEMLHRVLAEHPKGMQVRSIIAEMKRIGYRPTGDASGYVPGVAANDPNVIRVERGIYRLKDSLLNELRSKTEGAGAAAFPASVAVTEVAPTEIIDMPKETLLVRIDQLSRTNHALGNLVAAQTAAQESFIREMTRD